MTETDIITSKAASPIGTFSPITCLQIIFKSVNTGNIPQLR